MSVMLYPCILYVALLMDLFVLCVVGLTVFVNCLVKYFAMCLGVVAILLFNVMEVFSMGGGLCWIYHIWSFKECACCACDPSVHLSVSSICIVYAFVCRKLSGKSLQLLCILPFGMLCFSASSMMFVKIMLAVGMVV